MISDHKLLEHDVRKIVRLLAEVSIHVNDQSLAKSTLMKGLCRLIDADSWAWGLAKDVSPGEPSVHLSLIHGGFTEVTSAMFTRAYQHPDMTDVHTPLVAEMKRRNCHITRLRQQIDPDGRAFTNGAGPYWEKADIRGVILSMYPTPGGFISIMGIYRRFSASLFNERENLIAHVALGGFPWLHANNWSASCKAITGLCTRKRMITDFLIKGYKRKDIAKHLGISPHTTNDYVKSVFEHFQVHSQAELIGKFHGGGRL
ncbi:hypothetical protein JIN85_08000 [Luteolibacter pohnpeiensis]|uniref:HTH luxR-type domain-containing protein n=1 Tax=Luteolibacter pohnpeiensis TaxID=454153 RepID=A0A934VW16_9BACT|nr:LuxR C-terminal-related transcriptional regulator [Luteolibacter pohnpeiensis]MBK1882353.1 hypothetical protein [Luteolibacter pohnpeiensis]